MSHRSYKNGRAENAAANFKAVISALMDGKKPPVEAARNFLRSCRAKFTKEEIDASIQRYRNVSSVMCVGECDHQLAIDLAQGNITHTVSGAIAHFF